MKKIIASIIIAEALGFVSFAQGQSSIVQQVGTAVTSTNQAYITPAALAIMQHFPAGSCGRNPYQSKCPKPYPKYVWAKSDLNHPPGWLAVYLLANPGIESTLGTCGVQVTENQTEGYIPGAETQVGKGYMNCGTGAENGEVWLKMWERWNSDDQLHLMAQSPIKSETGSGTLNVSATAQCQYSSAQRWWRAWIYEEFHPYPPGAAQYDNSYQTDYGCLD
jgi:hypothetical protein